MHTVNKPNSVYNLHIFIFFNSKKKNNSCPQTIYYLIYLYVLFTKLSYNHNSTNNKGSDIHSLGYEIWFLRFMLSDWLKSFYARSISAIGPIATNCYLSNVIDTKGKYFGWTVLNSSNSIFARQAHKFIKNFIILTKVNLFQTLKHFGFLCLNKKETFINALFTVKFFTKYFFFTLKSQHNFYSKFNKTFILSLHLFYFYRTTVNNPANVNFMNNILIWFRNYRFKFKKNFKNYLLDLSKKVIDLKNQKTTTVDFVIFQIRIRKMSKTLHYKFPYFYKLSKLISEFWLHKHNKQTELKDNINQFLYRVSQIGLTSLSLNNTGQSGSFYYFRSNYILSTSILLDVIAKNLIYFLKWQHMIDIKLSYFDILAFLSTLYRFINRKGLFISKSFQISLLSKRNNSVISISTCLGHNLLLSSTGSFISENFFKSVVGGFNQFVPTPALSKITKRTGTLNRSGYMFAGLVRLATRLFRKTDIILKNLIFECKFQLAQEVTLTNIFISSKLHVFNQPFSLILSYNKFNMYIIQLLTSYNTTFNSWIKNCNSYVFKKVSLWENGYSNTKLNTTSFNICGVKTVLTSKTYLTSFLNMLDIQSIAKSNKHLQGITTFSNDWNFIRDNVYKITTVNTNKNWFRYLNIKVLSPILDNSNHSYNSSNLSKKPKKKPKSRLASALKYIVKSYRFSYVFSSVIYSNLFPYNREYRFRKYRFRRKKVKRLKLF